jgi:5-methylcytosine-specific restriction endonuclease McrA
MAIADGRLPWGKDNPHPMKGVTGPDHPGWKGGLTPERQAFYSSQEWVEAVKHVWARDDATCQKCGKRQGDNGERDEFHIHHIVTFVVRELRAEPSNLVLLCQGCHRWVHSKKNVSKKFIKDAGDEALF